MNTYDAQIIADSLSPDGVRLTTFQVTVPRFILAEFNTHRDKSRNSASSRAQPTEKLIERVRENPFVPETFNKRVKGMGVGDALEEVEASRARQAWLWAADNAAKAAEDLNEIGIDKSRANRLLEPFMWHTIVCTATEWSHFFGLRNHPAAQPEFQIVAEMMEELHGSHEPQKLDYGMWHLPYISEDEFGRLCRAREDHDRGQMHPLMFDELLNTTKLVSVRRCARVSWDKAGEGEPTPDAVEKAIFLKTNGHTSPFEHVARPLQKDDLSGDRSYKVMVSIGDIKQAERDSWQRGGHHSNTYWDDMVQLDRAWCGNFRGWWQMRKDIPNEDHFELIARASDGV